MSSTKEREELSIRYLLGDLSEKERTNLEERFFADDAEFQEMEIAEGELIDRYVRSELSATDRQQFERMLRTSPRLLERVEFARILALAKNDPEPIPAPVSPVDGENKKEKGQGGDMTFHLHSNTVPGLLIECKNSISRANEKPIVTRR